MLLDISKPLLLVVQIITTTTLLHIILLSNYCWSVESLPITSKPIESTAENLAWEAWLMVPVGQQQKSRKVTPKSIFIVPHKNNQTVMCPPGEHWSQNRCIPTVNIDTDKALLNQLSHLAPLSLDYDYDYEEEGNLSTGAEKLEGSADTNPFSVGDFPDEPLKFNIFSDTFPIGSSGSGDSSGSKDTDDENVFFVSERRRRPPTPPELSLPDLDTDSSTYGGNNQSANEDLKEQGSTLFLSGIDAILVPAVSDNEAKEQNMTFSIYQEKLNATKSPQIDPSEDEIIHELDEILENESLFLAKNSARVNTTTTTTATPKTTEKNETKTSSSINWETTTMKLEDEYEDVESKTEFTRSVTDLPPIEEEASQPTNFEIESTSTIIPKGDISTITEPKEDITTITSLKEELTTLETTSAKEPEISTISTMPDEEATTFTLLKDEVAIPQEVITTTHLPSDETTIVGSSMISHESDLLPNQKDFNDRFKYHPLTEENPLPPVINIVEELRKINDLVARKNTQPSTTPIPISSTTQNPSEEAISNPNNILSKIILVPSNSPAMKSSSEDPVPLSSTSTVWTSNSTSKNILSKNSSSSSSSSSSNTVSSTLETQESTSDPSSSTSPKPEITEPDPYWWLPTNWSTERAEADRPLLLRFWSAISGISGSQTKV